MPRATTTIASVFRRPIVRIGPTSSSRSVAQRKQTPISTLTMGIGKLYYITLAILSCAWLSVSHYQMWPEKGYAPHTNVGNKWHTEETKKKRKRAKREEQRRERREYECSGRRGHGGRRDSSPEWVDVTHLESVAREKFNTAAAGGRGSHVKFSDIQQSTATQGDGRKRSRHISSRYVPYSYIYGNGPVDANTPPAFNGTHPPYHYPPPTNGAQPAEPRFRPAAGYVDTPVCKPKYQHATVRSPNSSERTPEYRQLSPRAWPVQRQLPWPGQQ